MPMRTFGDASRREPFLVLMCCPGGKTPGIRSIDGSPLAVDQKRNLRIVVQHAIMGDHFVLQHRLLVLIGALPLTLLLLCTGLIVALSALKLAL